MYVYIIVHVPLYKTVQLILLNIKLIIMNNIVFYAARLKHL